MLRSVTNGRNVTSPIQGRGIVSCPSPHGITAKPIRAGINERIGARLKMILFAPLGMMSSFMKSFRPSAIGCSRPW